MGRWMTEPAFRYGVLRVAADMPAGFVPPELDGRWIDLDQVPDGRESAREWGPGAVAVPTDRFERRDSDGATARVYEFRV